MTPARFLMVTIILVIIISTLYVGLACAVSSSSDGFSSVLKRSLHHLYISYQFSWDFRFIIGFSFTVWTKKFANKRTETSNRMLTKFVSISSYSPEVRTFGTSEV